MSNTHPQKKRAGGGRGSRNVVALLRSVSLFFAKSGGGGGGGGGRPEHHAMRSDGKGSSKERRNTSHFTKQEIEALNLIYDRLVGEPVHNSTGTPPGSPKQQRKEGLERVVFRDLLHSTFGVSTEEILLDRIFSVFDASSRGLVKREEWLLGCSVFLKGSLEEKTAFAFNVYDLNSDGFIVREEMFTLLRNSLVKQPQDEDPDEGVKDLVELVLRKLDSDRDGKVSFGDFRTAVVEEPLFLEAFGQCLPSERAAAAFLATLS